MKMKILKKSFLKNIHMQLINGLDGLIIMHISVNSLSVALVSVESAEMQILLMAMIFLLSLIPTSIILISRIVKHKKNTVEQL